MQRFFGYTLLITWVLFSISCKTSFVQKSYETKNLSISSELNSLDNAVVEIYSPFKLELEKDMNRVISVSKTELSKGKPESLLTNFLADILLEQGKQIAKKNKYDFTPDISYFNYGGIRTYLPEGEITVGKIFELMPFENELVFLKLNGKQIQEFANVLAAKGGDSVGGIRFKIKNEKADNIEISGETLDENKNYWLATNDYVAGGGDDLAVLAKNSKMINTHEKIRDIIILHLEELHKNNKEIIVNLDGRISDE